MNKLFFSFLCLMGAIFSHGFAPGLTTGKSSTLMKTTSSSLHMGLFDSFKKAFANAEYAAPPEGVKASARHILVKSQAEAQQVMEELKNGKNFASLASQFSSCPSGAQGGSLGSFAPGTMVPAFDKVIFDPATNLGEVVGPVQTNFGYHLIVVDKRTGV